MNDYLNYLAIALAALASSALTFFTGFGLGTLLMPALVPFVAVTNAVVITAIVHVLNNFLKLALLRNDVHWKVAIVFGAPALLASGAGATVLTMLADWNGNIDFTVAGHYFQTSALKICLATFMAVIGIFEISPWVKQLSVSQKLLPLGGLLSGFFGGLSGHQGAFRSAFLLKAGLGKEQYIATGAIISILVDIARLCVYLPHFQIIADPKVSVYVILAILFALAGTLLGNKFLKKTSMKLIERIVSVVLIVMSVALGLGLI